MSRGFGATERAILRLLHPPHLDGEFVSLATITHRVYGHAEPNAVESVRHSLHRLARLDRVELARGTVEAEGWQRRLVARLVPLDAVHSPARLPGRATVRRCARRAGAVGEPVR